MQNIVPEYSSSHLATSECNKEHRTLDIYKHIVDEVYDRANNGDKVALDILEKSVKGVVLV
jgi:hypothetical protein